MLLKIFVEQTSMFYLTSFCMIFHSSTTHYGLLLRWSLSKYRTITCDGIFSGVSSCHRLFRNQSNVQLTVLFRLCWRIRRSYRQHVPTIGGSFCLVHHLFRFGDHFVNQCVPCVATSCVCVGMIRLCSFLPVATPVSVVSVTRAIYTVFGMPSLRIVTVCLSIDVTR